MATFECDTAAEFETAAAAAVSGDLITLAAGTYSGCFALTNEGVTVRGVGDSTVIAPDGSNAWAIRVRSDTVLEDFRIGPAEFPSTFGVGPAVLTDLTGVVARRLSCFGMSDFFYPDEVGMELLAEDCVCTGGVFFDMGPGDGSDANFTAVRCTGTNLNAFLANGPGTFTGIDCEADGNGSSLPLVNSFGGAVTLIGGTYQIDAGPNPVFKNDDAEGGVFRVLGVTYDAGNVEGTITVLPVVNQWAKSPARRTVARAPSRRTTFVATSRG